MNDVILLQIVSNAFWLILVVVIIGVFHRQLKSLLDSLGSLGIAGTHFEFRDKKETLESYAILSEILLQVLERRDDAEQLALLISDKSAQRLANFTIRYTKEVPKDSQDVDLLLNVALVLGRKGRLREAMQILEARLKKYPDDYDANNQKAVWLFNSGAIDKVRSADKIYDRLVDIYPRSGELRFNRALPKSLLGDYDQALSELKRAIELHYWKRHPNMLADSSLMPLKSAKPSEFKQVEEKVEDELHKSMAREKKSR
jgi:tetratricopeptide (TPR) repeat protein